jgi:hypothetical protein
VTSEARIRTKFDALKGSMDERMTRLRRENRILQQEREILRRAFFAKHQR